MGKKVVEYYDAFLDEYSFNCWIPSHLEIYVLEITKHMPQFHSFPKGSSTFTQIKLTQRLERPNLIALIEFDKSLHTPLKTNYANLIQALTEPHASNLRITLSDSLNYTRMILGANIILESPKTIRLFYQLFDDSKKQPFLVLDYSSEEPNIETLIEKLRRLHMFCQRTIPPMSRTI